MNYAAPPAMTIDQAKQYTATIETEKGDITLELFAADVPVTVNNFVFLAREGFYDNTTFHRVIAGFMAQGGDPTGSGMGGSDKPDLKQEFSKVPHERGTCSMARAQNPNSANSQFFICFDSAPFLNGQYTVWGQVVEGMEHVDAIKSGAPGSGTVSGPDKMISVKVAADAE